MGNLLCKKVPDLESNIHDNDTQCCEDDCNNCQSSCCKITHKHKHKHKDKPPLNI